MTGAAFFISVGPAKAELLSPTDFVPVVLYSLLCWWDCLPNLNLYGQIPNYVPGKRNVFVRFLR